MFTNSDQGFFGNNSAGAGAGAGFFGGNSFGGDAVGGGHQGNSMMKNGNAYGDQNVRKRQGRVFVPVTMKMVSEAEIGKDDSCEIDGEPINEIIIAGRVILQEEEPMRKNFWLNDNTGSFKVVFYMKGENEIPLPLKNFNTANLGWVKVYGTVRVFKNEKAIVGTHIKRMDKMDEVTNHMLQVFVAHCIRKQGVLTQSELRNNNTGTARASGAMGQNGNSGAASVGVDRKQTVLELMKVMSQNNKFIHLNDIFQPLKNRMQQQDLDETLAALCEDGVIYTSYNKDIYSVTEV